MQIRIAVAVLLVVAALAISAWAWLPALVTYAELPPQGLVYSLDDPESVVRALARATAIGRETMRETVWPRLEVLTIAFVLCVCVLGYFIVRGKQAA